MRLDCEALLRGRYGSLQYQALCGKSIIASVKKLCFIKISPSIKAFCNFDILFSYKQAMNLTFAMNIAISIKKFLVLNKVGSHEESPEENTNTVYLLNLLLLNNLKAYS